MHRLVRILIVLALGASLHVSEAVAAGSGTKDKKPKETPDRATELYNKGVEKANAGDFEAARKLFEDAADERDDDPDILNMLAFTQRKTGRLEEAFENYEKALEERRVFPQANEYLGEAHLQAALLQVEILRKYGDEAEKELAQLIAAFREAASSLQGDTSDKRHGTVHKW